MLSSLVIDGRDYSCGPWIDHSGTDCPTATDAIVEVAEVGGLHWRLPASEHVWGKTYHPDRRIARYRVCELAE